MELHKAKATAYSKKIIALIIVAALIAVTAVFLLIGQLAKEQEKLEAAQQEINKVTVTLKALEGEFASVQDSYALLAENASILEADKAKVEETNKELASK